MSDAPDTLAIVRQFGGDPADLPFWNACREGRFLLHRCNACGKHYWPASRCVTHGGEAMQWVDSSGHGEVYTYTVVHHAYTPSMKGKTPYVVAVVKLDEGPFFHSNIIERAPDDVAVGMRVKAKMQTLDAGLVGPVFEPE